MKYRKKPVVIEAMQFNGNNAPEIILTMTRGIHPMANAPLRLDVLGLIECHTLEGIMVAQKGDWIIKGIKGELYPCKPDIFEATYEAVAPDTRKEEE